MEGLEKQRRCGFLPAGERGEEQPVWARRTVLLTECPRSFVRPSSLTLIEEHSAWRMGGKGDLRGYPAKSVEAFTLLESELLREKNDA